MTTSIYELFSTKIISFEQTNALLRSLEINFYNAEYCCVIRIAPLSSSLDEFRWHEYNTGAFSYTVNKGYQNNSQFKEFIRSCLEDNQFETIDVEYNFATIIQIEVKSDVKGNSSKLASFCRNHIFLAR